jgi:hypothetical protein
MLYIYVSLHKPMTLAFIDLPVTGDQRSSPWSRRTRRELRDQAHLIMYDKLTQPAKGEAQSTESGGPESTNESTEGMLGTLSP